MRRCRRRWTLLDSCCCQRSAVAGRSHTGEIQRQTSGRSPDFSIRTSVLWMSISHCCQSRSTRLDAARSSQHIPMPAADTCKVLDGVWCFIYKYYILYIHTWRHLSGILCNVRRRLTVASDDNDDTLASKINSFEPVAAATCIWRWRIMHVVRRCTQ